MTAIKTNKNIKQTVFGNLYKDYPRFYENIFLNIKKTVDEFFHKDFGLRFMGISSGENILFYGDEYFVNKVPVTKMSEIQIRISANAISAILDNVLGVKEESFLLKNITDIEAGLIKSFTVALYKSIEDLLDKSEINKKIIQSAKEYDFTFYISANARHAGKIILTLPDYILKAFEPVIYSDKFSLEDFGKIKVEMNISAGSAKITLNDIKAIEEGDIILLENSNINEMSVLWKDKNIPFRINPNPSLIISIDNNGGNHMEDETSSKSQNMWDSILVDIVAEFDNVKLSLGELKQISEGLVIDVGSVYENKIKLRVENQIVATGELVILNERYGVRVDSVIKSKDSKKTNPKPSVNKAPMPKPSAGEKGKNPKGDENFDYSDFEIEDESI